jgi:hypothetical protein
MKGKLIRKVKTANCVAIGDVAGYLHHDGYIMVSINNKPQLAHRMIWIMFNGGIDENLQIDHINGVRDDNRIENLRLVTHQENQWNHTKAKGFYWHKKREKYCARIRVAQKQIDLGCYDNEEDAHNAYLNAKNEYHTPRL